MATIKVSSIRVEERQFTNEETGEVSNNFALIFDVAVPCMKKQDDGTFAESTTTSIVKEDKKIAAMLYAGCDSLKRVRTLKGSSLTASEFAAYLDGANAEITATKVAAGTVDGDYTWQHDGYKYDVKVSLASDIVADIKDAAKAIRRKALGL